MRWIAVVRAWSIPMLLGIEKEAASGCTCRRSAADLKRICVQSLYLFGSTARGDARADCDVDLFFDHEQDALSRSDVMDIGDAASTISGCRADATTSDSIDMYIRPNVEAGAIRAF